MARVASPPCSAPIAQSPILSSPMERWWEGGTANQSGRALYQLSEPRRADHCTSPTSSSSSSCFSSSSSCSSSSPDLLLPPTHQPRSSSLYRTQLLSSSLDLIRSRPLLSPQPTLIWSFIHTSVLTSFQFRYGHIVPLPFICQKITVKCVTWEV